MERHDALVVGAGPAGSSCARALREGGADVLVLERAPFPRDKPCAGWVAPAAFQTLGLDLDDYAAGRTLQPLQAFRVGLIGGRCIELEYPRPIGYAVRRCELDEYLLRLSGAHARTGVAVERVRRADGEWVVNESIRTPLLIGAGGQFCPVARALRPAAYSAAVDASLVLAQEIEWRLERRDASLCRVRPGAAELYFSPDLAGYGWCLRKGEYMNVGFGHRGPGPLAPHVRAFVRFLAAEGRLPSGLPSRWRGHAYRLYEAPSFPRIEDGALLVGDAAGLAAPASGEGIRPAVESGLLAARAVLAARGSARAADLESYRSALEKRFGRPRARPRPRGRLAGALASVLLAARPTARHVVLDRLFLQRGLRSLPAAWPGRGAERAELFAELSAPRPARGGPQWLVSLFVHACAAALVLLLPLFLTQPPPEPLQAPLRIFLGYDPPPPPPPPPARGAGLAPRPIPAATPSPPEPRSEPSLVAPVQPATVAPTEEAPSLAGGDPEGSTAGDPLGMPGGVPGGVVGGVPGGVLGGVIGGTGTGPIPVPVLRPDRPPRPIRMTKPVYPQDAFVKKIEGTVRLEILIDEQGRVVRARVLESVPALDQEALRTVQSWLFVPALHAGRPVATIAYAPVTFRIY